MCGGHSSPPPTPAVVKDDPQADAAKNAAIATRQVNSQLAQAKRKAALTSLFTVGQAGLSPQQQAAVPTLFNSAYGVSGASGG